MIINRTYGKGGGGGLLPQIIASAPNGSTVTCDGNPPKATDPVTPNPAWRGLPSGYTQVEYIQSSGTQWIITGFKPTVNSKIEVDFQYPSVTSPAYIMLNGLGWVDALSQLPVFFGINYSPSTFGIRVGNSVVGPGNADTNRHTVIMDIPNNYAYFDSNSYSIANHGFTGTSLTFALFGRMDTATAVDRNCGMKVFEAIYSESSVKVNHLIPCYCTEQVTAYKGTTQTTAPANTVGLYDLVENKFYINSGDGTFTAGAEVPENLSPNTYYYFDVAIPTQLNPAWRCLPSGYKQVEYLESSGTEYIDSGISDSNGYSVDTEFEFSSLTDWETIVACGYDASNNNTRNYISKGTMGITIGANGYSNGTFFTPTTNTRYSIVGSTVNQTITINGTTYNARNYSWIVSYSPPYCSFTICIGASHGGSVSNITDYFYGKFYYVKLYDSTSTLRRDFVPCINPSNVAGMYDLVSNTFFANAGTGTFAVGNEVPKYLDSPHTVVGTLNGKTDTKTVNVSAIEQYAVTLSYGRLPSGYTEVEYIQSSATSSETSGAYINTGLNVTTDGIKVETKARLISTARNNTQGLLAVYTDASYYGLWMQSAGAGISIQSNTTRITSGILMDANTDYVIVADKTSLTVNDTVISGSLTMITVNKPLYMFARNINGSSIQEAGQARCYYMKIYNATSGVLLRDFVPCINSSNVVGMYDTVNSTFYSNSGSGSFTAGNPV